MALHLLLNLTSFLSPSFKTLPVMAQPISTLPPNFGLLPFLFCLTGSFS